MAKKPNMQHKLSFIGAGYVGLVSGTCLAEIGHTVTLVDKDKSKIDTLKRGDVPIYEPGLKELVQKNAAAGRLRFTTSLPKATKESDVIFIAVNTPPAKDGQADLSFVKAAVKEIAESADAHKVVVNKSTVPVTTGDLVAKLLRKHNPRGVDFDVVSNPEFLREGSAIEDFMKGDRVVIGVDNERAEKIMKEIYAPLNMAVFSTDVKSAELIKYASNSFLATKISFINAVARVCELTGGNIDDVAKGMGLDKRIGKHFLQAGAGYGGSCFDAEETAYTFNSPHLRTQTFKEAFSAHKTRKGSRIAKEKHLEIVQNSHAKALSFDFDEKKRVVAHSPITALTKRPYEGPMVTITTKLGRVLRVTADHPVITYHEKSDDFTVLPAVNVKTGDRMALALGLTNVKPAQPTNLLDAIKNTPLEHEAWVRPLDDSFKQLPLSTIKAIPQSLMKYPEEIRRTNCMRADAYMHLDKKKLVSHIPKEHLRLFTTKGNPTYCPVIFQPDKKLARLLGYYLSEGWISQDVGRKNKIRNRIGICFHKDEKEYINDVKKILDSYGIRYHLKHENKITAFTVSSRPLAFLLRDVWQCGTNSNNKQLPPFTFNLDQDDRLGLLQGLFRGDGSVTPVNNGKNVYIEYATTSKPLAEGAVLLLQSLHVVPSIRPKWMNKSKRPAYVIRVNGVRQLKMLPSLFGKQDQRKMERILSSYKKSIAPTGFTLHKNFATVPIIKTELTASHKGNVYSMETGNGILVSSGGIIVHNCFPKDVSAFISIAGRHGYSFDLLKEVEHVNANAQKILLRKIKKAIGGTKNKTVAMWGLAFKPNTDDVRSAPSIAIAKDLHKNGITVQAYDPKAHKTAKAILGNSISYAKDKYQALKNADVLVIITDWPEFAEPDWEQVRSLLHEPVIIDGRNMFSPQEMEQKGFVYHSVGRE